jgi:hypothetical protein
MESFVGWLVRSFFLFFVDWLVGWLVGSSIFLSFVGWLVSY